MIQLREFVSHYTSWWIHYPEVQDFAFPKVFLNMAEGNPV